MTRPMMRTDWPVCESKAGHNPVDLTGVQIPLDAVHPLAGAQLVAAGQHGPATPGNISWQHRRSEFREGRKGSLNSGLLDSPRPLVSFSTVLWSALKSPNKELKRSSLQVWTRNTRFPLYSMDWVQTFSVANISLRTEGGSIYFLYFILFYL